MLRKADKNDLAILANLAVLIWNNSTIDTLLHELSEMIARENVQFFLKFANNTPRLCAMFVAI